MGRIFFMSRNLIVGITCLLGSGAQAEESDDAVKQREHPLSWQRLPSISC